LSSGEQRGDIQGAVKLADVVDRPVTNDEAWGVADYLLACLTHVSNARPLFGVFCTRTGQLEWTAGGAEFYRVLSPLRDNTPQLGSIALFSQLLLAFGLSAQDGQYLLEDAAHLSPGAAMTVLKPLVNARGLSLRVVLRRRDEPHDNQVQFTIMDVSAFQETARRTRVMAQAFSENLDASEAGELSVRSLLASVMNDLQTLFDLHDDGEIKRLAQDMSLRVTTASSRMVAMLRTFEEDSTQADWQPKDLNPGLRPVIAAHNAPVTDWHELHSKVLCTKDGEPALIGELAAEVIHAHSFVQNAASIMLISPSPQRFFALNGQAAQKEFATVESLVRAIGVEENSTQTAVAFFDGIKDLPALGLFSVDGSNVEAWGRPGLYGGWQAMLLPSAGAVASGGVDVRGLFHGLKNLLLHLQVLYVVNTRADVDQVQEGLRSTIEKIQDRLSDLETVAKTGHRDQLQVKETVAQWLAAAERVQGEVEGEVEIISDGMENIVFTCAPSEMEDTLEELVRNAFEHGAGHVSVGAMIKGDHVCMHVTDDGKGMAPDKLGHVREVLKTRRYDVSLTTRQDGTGNGLLAAANAVSRFVDGQLCVDSGPDGRGVKVTISMKLPA
jgi:two-component sensor histidine kinase